MELLWWPDADEAMNRLESDRGSLDVLTALRRTLGRLEVDPFDPKLGSRQFVTQGFEQVRATPVRHGDWWVLWRTGPEVATITILLITEIAR